MTKNAMDVLRKIYEGRKKGYVLYLDGTRVLPSKGNNSLLVYDDANEIVYSLRPATPPYTKSSDVNVLATEYAQVFCFDMDIPIEDTKDILNDFISKGLISENDATEFLNQMKCHVPDKGKYGELRPDLKVVQ